MTDIEFWVEEARWHMAHERRVLGLMAGALGFEVDTRIHKCIRPRIADDKWDRMVVLLEAMPDNVDEPECWEGAGHYFQWTFWDERFRRIYYCPVCGVKLDA